MIRPLFLAISSGLLGLVAGTPSTADWAQKSVYQIMTDRFARTDGSTDASCDLWHYCGGTWAGITKKLDYVQSMGFTAIQISPVVQNIPNDTLYGDAYHGYWVQNLYALNDHFGSADDLKNLISEVHNRGMYIMVDVVINNMAQAINGTMEDKPQPKIDYSKIIPFNDQKYYHPYCNITNWSDPENYQRCWFGVSQVALPDLDTESSTVSTMTQDWAKQLLSNYSFDAVRIDAAKHVNDAYLSDFSKAVGVLSLGEIFSGDSNFVCRYLNSNLVTSFLNYPVYYGAMDAFINTGDMARLAQEINNVKSTCKDFTPLITFMENQDLPRVASQSNDTAIAKNAMAVNLLSDGIPMVWEGQEQHLSGGSAPYNRGALWTTGYSTSGALYNLTVSLNTLRSHAIGINNQYVANHSQQLYLDKSTYATKKGPDGSQIVAVFSNQGSPGGSYQLQLGGGFAPGTQVMEILGCTKTTADNTGNITVQMGGGEPKVFFPASSLNNSGLCGYSKKASTNPTDSSSTNSTNATKNFAEHHCQMPLSALFACTIFTAFSWLL
ncbi:Glycoside hydrolase superfamily [Elaphomyces granulatus]